MQAGAARSLSSVARKSGRAGPQRALARAFATASGPTGAASSTTTTPTRASTRTSRAARSTPRRSPIWSGRSREPEAARSARRARASAADGAPARPRNVVLIVVDDLNTRVGAWGAPVKTPAIDRLAARGVRFDRAYAQVAMCSPSRASMLTGWRPERTGVWQNEDPPRPAGAVPLQELFAAHGACHRVDREDLPLARGLSLGRDGRSTRRSWRSAIPARPATEPAGLWVKAPGGDLDQPDGRRARRAASLVERQRRDPSSSRSVSCGRTCAGWRRSATSACTRPSRSRHCRFRPTTSPTCRRSR